jgi:hypothetical protein
MSRQVSGSAGTTITVEKIGPPEAQTLLAKNFSNRRIRASRIAMYADMMTRGQWLLTGEPIIVRADGSLVNGQHRLLAIIQSGTTQEFAVVRNAPEGVFEVVDTGLSRSPGDVMDTSQYVTTKAAAIRALWVVEAGGDPRKTADLVLVSRHDLAEYYREHQGEIDAAAEFQGTFQGKFHNYNPSAMLAFIVLAWRYNKAKGEEFLYAVREGTGLDRGDPRLVLRNSMASVKPKRTSRGIYLMIYIKMFNAWLEGETRQAVYYSSEEDFPEVGKRSPAQNRAREERKALGLPTTASAAQVRAARAAKKAKESDGA